MSFYSEHKFLIKLVVVSSIVVFFLELFDNFYENNIGAIPIILILFIYFKFSPQFKRYRSDESLILLIIGAILIISFGIGNYLSNKWQTHYLVKESIKTKGKIISIGYSKKGKSATVEYSVNGVSYTQSGGFRYGDLIGDTVTVFYNPEHPQIAKVVRYNPIIITPSPSQ
jgi:hypothetical protein